MIGGIDFTGGLRSLRDIFRSEKGLEKERYRTNDFFANKQLLVSNDPSVARRDLLIDAIFTEFEQRPDDVIRALSTAMAIEGCLSDVEKASVLQKFYSAIAGHNISYEDLGLLQDKLVQCINHGAVSSDISPYITPVTLMKATVFSNIGDGEDFQRIRVNMAYCLQDVISSAKVSEKDRLEAIDVLRSEALNHAVYGDACEAFVDAIIVYKLPAELITERVRLAYESFAHDFVKQYSDPAFLKNGANFDDAAALPSRLFALADLEDVLPEELRDIIFDIAVCVEAMRRVEDKELEIRCLNDERERLQAYYSKHIEPKMINENAVLGAIAAVSYAPDAGC
jgi:hypothetical protein